MKYLSLMLILLLTSSCGFIRKYYPDDNPIEEGLEDVIKRKIGVDIDFTPSSPEKP